MIGGTWQGKTPLGLHELRGFQKGYSAGERKACSHQLGAGWGGVHPSLIPGTRAYFISVWAADRPHPESRAVDCEPQSTEQRVLSDVTGRPRSRTL